MDGELSRRQGTGISVKIDFHCHAFPEAFFLKLQEYYPEEVNFAREAHGTLIANRPVPRFRPGIMRSASKTWTGAEWKSKSCPTRRCIFGLTNTVRNFANLPGFAGVLVRSTELAGYGGIWWIRLQ